MLAGGPIRRDLQAHRATARVAEQPPASTPVSLPERTNLSSKRRPGGETLAEPGDAGVHLALVVLEPDFCVLDRAGTRAALSETDEMDDFHNSRSVGARDAARVLEVVHSEHEISGHSCYRSPRQGGAGTWRSRGARSIEAMTRVLLSRRRGPGCCRPSRSVAAPQQTGHDRHRVRLDSCVPSRSPRVQDAAARNDWRRVVARLRWCLVLSAGRRRDGHAASVWSVE